MEDNQRDPDIYSLPFIIHSSYKLRMHVLFLFMIVMFVGFSFIPINDLGGILFRVFSLVLGIFFVYAWLYMGVIKKAYVELTEDGISLKTIFTSKKLKWTDIVDVQTYYANNNSFIGIISKEKMKKRRDNFLTQLSDLLGGKYSLSIPLKPFSQAEPAKLYATIFYTAQEKAQHNGSDEENVDDWVEKVNDEKTNDGSPVTALFKALLVSLACGTVYGVSIFVLQTNFIIIPVLGTMGILFTYFKSYQEKGFNIIIRFFLGILCTLQFFVALLVALLMLNTDLIEANGVWRTIYDCTVSITKYPEEYIAYYVFGTICFFIGTFLGYSSKTTRRIRKIFLHNQNGFYIKREKRFVSIYLIDYAEYNEKEEKTIIRINPNVCLIEREKKNILAFSIPEELIKDFNIDAKNFERVSSSEKVYYRLDLGGRAEQQLYGYTSLLTLNQHRQVILIQLEND